MARSMRKFLELDAVPRLEGQQKANAYTSEEHSDPKAKPFIYISVSLFGASAVAYQ